MTLFQQGFLEKDSVYKNKDYKNKNEKEVIKMVSKKTKSSENLSMETKEIGKLKKKTL